MRRTLIVAAGVLALAGCGQERPDSDVVPSEGTASLIPNLDREARSRGPAGYLSELNGRIQLVDEYGRVSETPALTMIWPGQELERIRWDRLPAYGAVNLAHLRIEGPLGVAALADWCDRNGVTLTPRLCTNERAEAEAAWVSRGAPEPMPQAVE